MVKTTMSSVLDYFVEQIEAVSVLADPLLGSDRTR